MNIFCKIYDVGHDIESMCYPLYCFSCLDLGLKFFQNKTHSMFVIFTFKVIEYILYLWILSLIELLVPDTLKVKDHPETSSSASPVIPVSTLGPSPFSDTLRNLHL